MTYQVRDKETDETLVERISHGNPELWQVVALQEEHTNNSASWRASGLCEHLPHVWLSLTV